ncbi:MAG: M6 family metalloprotease domain-containing protein, partial [Armatimonadota bacterium]
MKTASYVNILSFPKKQTHWIFTSMIILGLVFCAISGSIAQQLMPPSPHLPSDVRAAMRREEAQSFRQRNRPAHPVRDVGKKSVVNAPATAPIQLLVSGSKQMPCILMNFPNLANTYSAADFQNLLFTNSGIPTGSVKDYYTEVSFNQLSLSGLTEGWYTTNNTKSYYADKTGRYADCAYEAAQKADASGFDWAPYDNDHDGYVDTLWVIHSGLGAEETGSTKTDIWSHSWDFQSAGIGVFTTSTPDTYNPGSFIKINNYIIQPELSYWSGGNGASQMIVGIGVFCHEFGHALGLPDLYDTGGTGEGLGNASLMAGGSWGGNGNDSRYPAHMDAWCKVDLGWLTPFVVTNDDDYTVANYSINDAIDPYCYLVKPFGSTANQYFLVENRQHHGYDRTLFATGLFIYHIDTDIINDYIDLNTVNSNTHAYGVALEEADTTTDSYSSMHLFTGTNRGLLADAWPNSTRTAFSATSIPSTKMNTGAIQQCSITTVSTKSDTMLVNISVGNNTAPTIISISPDTSPNNGIVNITDINGTNFLDGATVKLTKTGETDIAATNVSVVSSTKITCNFDLTDKTVGAWNVDVTNTDLQSGTLPGGFTITDVIPPSVTINQASGQADPTDTSPINFTVVFSEPVDDFATGDVALSGTANATIASVSGSGTTYDVAVTGMTRSGTVIAEIAAGVAHDAAGNANMSSTSTDNTVMYRIGKPDMIIKTGAETSYTGTDIYNTDGTDQTKSQSVIPNQKITYAFKVRNAGIQNDSFKITGSGGGSGWSVKYYDLATGADVTAQVTGIGWSSGTLAPGASKGIFVNVKPDVTVSSGSVNVLFITGVSEFDDSKTDVVKAVTNFVGSYKTDMIIKTGSETSYTGTGIFNTDGSNQTKSLNISLGQKVTYAFRAMNAGNAYDSFRITGTAGESGWSVKYYDISTNVEVTSQVTGDGWVSGTIGPRGSTGVYANIRF